MPLRSRMDFDDPDFGAPGSAPDFGAIFMSNNATKGECFRRKIFGLPSSQAYFVKHVKAGMILFLFEFERRELHGVFQACSDGAINIVPHAFSSSGKKFPAQVEFTRIWYCSPLSEAEFCDAIRENYFSEKKFNFGLSEAQVHRLLSLFNLKKFKKQSKQRSLTRTEVARPIEHSLNKFRRAVEDSMFSISSSLNEEHNVADDGGSVVSTKYPGNYFGDSRREINDGRLAENARVGGEHITGSEFDLLITNEYFGDSSGNVGKVADSGSRFTTSNRIGNELNVDSNFRQVVSSGYSGYSLDDIGQAPDDTRFAMSGRVESECYGSKGFGPDILSDYPGSWSKLNTSADPSKPVLEVDSVIHSQLRSSLKFCSSMEPEISNLPYPTSYGDAIVTSTLPYDLEAPSINFRVSSSFGVNNSSKLVQEYDPPHDSHVGNILPSFRNQSFPSYMDPGGASNFSDINIELGNHVPSYSNLYEYCSRTSMPRAAYSENMASKFSDDEGYKGLSFPMPFSAPLVSVETGNHARRNEYSSSYSFSPCKYSSFVYDVVSRDKLDRIIPKCESNETFATHVHMLKDDWCRACQLHDCICSVEHRSIDHHESILVNLDVHQNSGHMQSCCQKNRNSVFTRLALAPEVCEPENSTPDIDHSLDELHQCHYQWEKTKKCRPIIKRYDDAETFRNKMQTACTSTKMNITDIPPIEENGSPVAEQSPFVDFKRRSEVRKAQDDMKTGGCSESAKSEVSSSGQNKRRKLIRPNFSKDESSENEHANINPLEEMLVTSLESCVYRNDVGSCEVLVTSCVCENKISQNVEKPSYLTCQISCNDENIDTERLKL